MRYIKALEKHAHSVKKFPYKNLEVDYIIDNKVVIVSLYWSGIDGTTNKKTIAWIPQEEFKYWPFTCQARRFIISRVCMVGGVEQEYIRPERKQFMSLKTVKETPLDSYYLVKDGEVYEVEDHQEFCYKHNLNKCMIKEVVLGKIRSHKGFHLPSTNSCEVITRGPSSKERTFRHIETGRVVHTSNMAQFCRDEGLVYGNFKKVAQKSRKTAYGWECLS